MTMVNNREIHHLDYQRALLIIDRLPETSPDYWLITALRTIRLTICYPCYLRGALVWGRRIILTIITTRVDHEVDTYIISFQDIGKQNSVLVVWKIGVCRESHSLNEQGVWERSVVCTPLSVAFVSEHCMRRAVFPTQLSFRRVSRLISPAPKIKCHTFG